MNSKRLLRAFAPAGQSDAVIQVEAGDRLGSGRLSSHPGHGATLMNETCRAYASCCAALFLCWALPSLAETQAFGDVFWTTSQTIHRASMAGNTTGEEIMVVPEISPGGVQVDPDTGALYLLDRAGAIVETSRTGGDTQVLVDGLAQPRAFLFDDVGKRFFWSDADGIHVADVDGTDRQTVYASDALISYLTFDAASDLLFWTELDALGQAASLRRARADGGDVVTLASAPGNTDAFAGVAVDARDAMVYYIKLSITELAIRRVSFDGADDVSIFSDPFLQAPLHLEPRSRKLYFALFDLLVRTDLNGDGLAIVATDVDRSVGAIDTLVRGDCTLDIDAEYTPSSLHVTTRYGASAQGRLELFALVPGEGLSVLSARGLPPIDPAVEFSQSLPFAPAGRIFVVSRVSVAGEGRVCSALTTVDTGSPVD